jgi:hypothetical protein
MRFKPRSFDSNKKKAGILYRSRARLLRPRLLLAGFLSFFPLACGTPPPSPEALAAEAALREFMDTSPGEGGLVFLGVASVRSRIQESVNLALEEAARRIAIFREVEGEFTSYAANTGRLLDYRAETTASLRHDPAYRDYLEAVEFDEGSDVLRSENAVFVRVRYPGSLNINYRPSGPRPGGKPGDKPSWIESPPAMIGEYNAGVGYAGRRGAHRDTVTASYENAVFSIIRDLSTVSWERSVDYRGEGFLGGEFTVRQTIDAKGRLTGFYALETWTDPSDKSVWTLAVAKGAAF